VLGFFDDYIAYTEGLSGDSDKCLVGLKKGVEDEASCKPLRDFVTRVSEMNVELEHLKQTFTPEQQEELKNDTVAKAIAAIGRNIKNKREEKRLTQEQLAEKADISEKNLSALENGRLKNISICYLIDIAEALKLTNYKELL